MFKIFFQVEKLPKNCSVTSFIDDITLHGMRVLVSNIYPGSISKSNITEKSGVLKFVEEKHELTNDKGFILDLWYGL